jgi:methyl acetate hydrolase
MSTMQQLLDDAIGAEAAPGASATIVDRDGTIFEGAAGVRAAGSQDTMTVDTVGRIFSMTKAITGAAAMQCVERGLLDLDAPAGSVIPYLGEAQVLVGFGDDGAPVLRPPTAPVTLRNLLTHTSGFVYEIWNADEKAYRERTEMASLFTRAKAALRSPLAFDPGTRWEYGIGIDWVGQLIEAVTGSTLGAFLESNLTGPLRMNDTSFAPSPSMSTRLASMHARLPDGSLLPIELPEPDAPEFEMGGGGLFGTTSDYGRFIRMILNDGTLDGVRVLEPETVQTMCRNHIGDLRVGPLRSVNPQFSNDAEFFPGRAKSWGLTFQINEEACDTGRPVGTLMWAGLANSFYWIDRTNGIGGAYLSQILPFGDERSLGLFLDLEREAYESHVRAAS